MVNYNAFNVDPLPYQRAAMGNFRNAMDMRNQQAQQQKTNAFNQQQQSDLLAQQQAENAMEQQRIGVQQERNNLMGDRTDVMQQRADVESKQFKAQAATDSFNLAVSQSSNPEQATQMYRDDYFRRTGEEPEGNFAITEVGPYTTTEMDTPNGRISMRLRSHKSADFMEAIKQAGENPQAIQQIISDFGVEVKPARVEKPTKPEKDVYAEARYKDISKAMSDIDKTLRAGTTTDESGVPVPLDGIAKKRLKVSRMALQNEIRELRGKKPVWSFKDPDSVKIAFEDDHISRQSARKYIKQMFKVPPAKAVEPKPSEKEPVEPVKNVEATNTEERKAFMASDRAKEPGYKALLRKTSKEERDEARKKRKERQKKAFLRQPPK